MKAKLIDILLVEDNPGDVDLTREALEESKIKNNLYVAIDGQQALDFLYKKGKYSDSPKPDLILLDLNLPNIDGRTVLENIKEHKDLRRIPVVILTSSKAEEDIIKAYNLHANCYVQKPLDYNSFTEMVKNIELFWMGIVVLPTK
ncbi:MAG: response regulator [Desulfobulbaceae bacterium]|nr:response regulator [Desulfobulbaceae bacterium]